MKIDDLDYVFLEEVEGSKGGVHYNIHWKEKRGANVTILSVNTRRDAEAMLGGLRDGITAMRIASGGGVEHFGVWKEIGEEEPPEQDAT